MKVVYLANQRLPTEKAYGIQIAKMCEAFADLDMDVSLVMPTRPNPSGKTVADFYGTKNNFREIRLFSPDFYFPGKLDRAAVFLKSLLSSFRLCFYALRSSADVIYSRDEMPVYILTFFRKNIVFEAHKFSRNRLRLYRRFKNVGVKAVVISEGLRREFVDIGFDKDKILVAHDGVDIDKFSIDMTKSEARKRLSLPENDKLVIYSGHLFDWKGADILAEAARFIPGVRVIFVGGMNNDIENFKKRFGSVPNVVVLGRRDHREIPIYLKAADVLVLPNKSGDKISESYTSPLKLFEYMASGRPIVASNLPSIAEILNSSNSLLFSPDNPRLLADAIQDVLEDGILAENISKKALGDVKSYSWRKRAENIIEFLAY